MSRSTMTGPAMNVGNQIGTRPSTRVHGPPGGATSISLGWGVPEPAPVRVSTVRAPGAGAVAAAAPAAPAAPAAAPYGGGSMIASAAASVAASAPFATSAAAAPAVDPYRPAPAIAVRADSRDNVLFGAAAPAYGAAKPAAAAAAAAAAASVVAPPAAAVAPPRMAVTAASAAPVGAAPAPVYLGGAGAVSSSSYASGANQNCGNVLTDRRTTRVLSAPGGRTSLVLG